MKITILVQRFPPKWLAGTELAAYNIAKFLSKKNHDVTVITELDPGCETQSTIEGFKVYRVKRPNIRFFGFLIFWFKIFWNIKEIKPEIIHVQGIYFSIPAFLAKKLLNIPYVVSGQGSDVYNDWPFKKLISKFGLNNSKLSIALTQHMKKEMQKICKKRIEVVPNGINNEDFNLNKYEARKKLGISQDQKIIIFVGRLEPVKGLKYLMESMAILKSSEKNLKLLVVGDGIECQKLKLLVKTLKLEETVVFIGKIINAKIPEYLSASDIFVLPSLSEGFPVVLLEAMSSGLPIIATKVKGLGEIIEEGTNGFLVTPKNSEELADKISLLVNNETLIENIFISNKNKSNFYDWKNIVEILLTNYTN